MEIDEWIDMRDGNIHKYAGYTLKFIDNKCIIMINYMINRKMDKNYNLKDYMI